MNVYKLFRDLLPDPALQIGTVQSVSNGTATILMIDGGIAKARGNATVGQRVFFRNDVIEALAPSLSIEVIDV
jgi:hypothetical protein